LAATKADLQSGASERSGLINLSGTCYRAKTCVAVRAVYEAIASTGVELQ